MVDWGTRNSNSKGHILFSETRFFIWFSPLPHNFLMFLSVLGKINFFVKGIFRGKLSDTLDTIAIPSFFKGLVSLRVHFPARSVPCVCDPAHGGFISLKNDLGSYMLNIAQLIHCLLHSPPINFSYFLSTLFPEYRVLWYFSASQQQSRQETRKVGKTKNYFF